MLNSVDPELDFGRPEDRMYQGPFMGRDVQNRADVRNINEGIDKTKKQMVDISKKF